MADTGAATNVITVFHASGIANATNESFSIIGTSTWSSQGPYADYNGHIWARCTTENCIQWME